RGLAAQADVHAPVRRPAHATGERDPADVAGRAGRLAQVAGHRRRAGDLAGVHPVVRVEQPLGLTHRRVQRVTEHGTVELAADQPVAVLAGVDAAELQYQVADLLGDRAHGLHLPGLGQVHERADVQAADGAVAVEARGQPVRAEDLPEPAGVV